MLPALTVFVLAFAVRWPSCGESLWVDELHTAWCVSGSLEQVAHRAEMGNQQSGYFGALWVWYHMLPSALVSLYGIEALLRLTSVVLVSLSAAWLVGIVCNGTTRVAGRSTNSWIGGIAAGLALGLESSSIFFGTELRPYAAIVFLTTAMLAVWQRRSGLLTSLSNPNEKQIAIHTLGIHLLAMLAAATHVTSLIVLAPLVLLIGVGDCVSGFRKSSFASTNHSGRTNRFRMIGVHVIAAAVWSGLAVWWCHEYAEIWNSRAAWASFAVARSWGDVWRMWPWLALVVVPGVSLGLTRLAACFWSPNDSIGQASMARERVLRTIALLFSVVLFSTLACFFLSRWNVVALWHRRYLIASLPILCVVFGLTLNRVESALSQDFGVGHRGLKRMFAAFLAMACLLLMTFQQGTLDALSRGELRLAQRGEDWRSAIAFARQQTAPGETVWIDAGLIEQNGQPLLVDDAALEEYLRYVTAGPYRFGVDVRLLGCGSGAIATWGESLRSDDLFEDKEAFASVGASPAVLVTRRVIDRAKGNTPKGDARNETWRGRRFGRVTVLIRR